MFLTWQQLEVVFGDADFTVWVCEPCHVRRGSYRLICHWQRGMHRGVDSRTFRSGDLHLAVEMCEVTIFVKAEGQRP